MGKTRWSTSWTGTRKRRKPKSKTNSSPTSTTKKKAETDKVKPTGSKVNSVQVANCSSDSINSSKSPEIPRKVMNNSTSNANEIPVDCARGRRTRGRMSYVEDMISSSEEDQDNEKPEDNGTDIARAKQNRTPEMPVLVPEVSSVADAGQDDSGSESVSEDGKNQSPSSSNTQSGNRKRRRKKKLFTTRKSPRTSSPSKTVNISSSAPPASHDNLPTGDLSDFAEEVEIKEPRICLTRVNDLEEFRESLRQFEENLAKSLSGKTETAKETKLVGSDSESESEDEKSESSEEDDEKPGTSTAKPTFRCRPCKSSFEDEDSLKSHMEKVHPQEPQRTKCNYCSRFFPNPMQLEAHEAFHSNKTKLSSFIPERMDYVCQFCQARFKKPNGLSRHISQKHSLARGSLSVDLLDKNTRDLRRQIAVARKHIRPIRKDPIREPPSPFVSETAEPMHVTVEPVLQNPEPVQTYQASGPIYVRNGIIELGPVKEEIVDETFEPQEEDEVITPMLLNVGERGPKEEDEDEAYPLADMLEVDEVSPPIIDPSESVIPFDMTNGVKCSISDMGSLLDLLDGPDPNAGVPGFPKAMLTLNYEDGVGDKAKDSELASDRPGRFKCEFCPRVLGSKMHLLAHRRESHSARIRKPYICMHPNCSQRFESSQSLQFHRNKEHARKEDVVAEAPIVRVPIPIPEPVLPQPVPVLPNQPVQEIVPNVPTVREEIEPEGDTDVGTGSSSSLAGHIAPTSAEPALEDLPESARVVRDPTMPLRLTDGSEDLLLGFKYACPMCGAKFKKMSTYLQHEWLHSDEVTRKQIQRRRKLELKWNVKDKPKPYKRRMTVNRALGPKQFLGRDAADEEEESAASAPAAEGHPQGEPESDVSEIPIISQVVSKPKPVQSVAPVQKLRNPEPTSISVGSPQSSSNSSSDDSASTLLPISTIPPRPVQLPVPAQTGVSFRICRDPPRYNIESKICDICAHVCYGTFGLENHMLTVHNMILCIACNLCSTSQAAHEIHLLSDHPDHEHFCRPCIKLLHNASHFARHGDSEPHKLKVQQRDHEMRAAETEVNLDCEVECQHRNFICDICSSGQHSLPKLELHVLQIHQQFLCTICQKLYGSRSGLELHRRGHVGESKFDCLMCMIPFKKKASLSSHQKSRGHMTRVREINQSAKARPAPPIVLSTPLPETGERLVFVQVAPNQDSAEVIVGSDPAEAEDDEAFRVHELLRNPQTGDYQCCLCMDEFLDYEVFDDHMVIGHDVSLFKKISARVCKIFKSLNQKPQIFKCTACKKIFLDNSSFRRHWMRFHSSSSTNQTPNSDCTLETSQGDSDIEILEDDPPDIPQHQHPLPPVLVPTLTKIERNTDDMDSFPKIQSVSGTLHVNDIRSVTTSVPSQASAQNMSKKLFVPIGGSPQLAQMLQQSTSTGRSTILPVSSTPGSIVAPMRTVYACGQCDNLYSNQVDLNNHVVGCRKTLKPWTPLDPKILAQHVSDKTPIPMENVRITVPKRPPQVVDLTSDDEDSTEQASLAASEHPESLKLTDSDTVVMDASDTDMPSNGSLNLM